MCLLKAPETAYERLWEESVLPKYSPLVRTRRSRSVVVGFAVDYTEAEVVVILWRLVSKAGQGPMQIRVNRYLAQGTDVIDGTFRTRQQVKLSILVDYKAVLRLQECGQPSVSAMRTLLTAAC